MENENFTKDELYFLNIISPFNYRELQTFINIKKHLELNGSNADNLQQFIEKFSIIGNKLRRRDKPKSQEEKRIRKENLETTQYGKIEYKP